MSFRLFVGNLAPVATSEELQELFSGVGEVKSCQVIIDRETGRSKGFAFIEMDSQEIANTAKEKFNGQDMHGRAIKVSDAKPKNEQRSRDN